MKTRRSGIIAGLIVVGVILAISFVVVGPEEEVEVMQAQVRDVTELLVTSGQLQVRPSSDLSMSVSAVIETIHVEEGDRVEAGAVLLELEESDVAQQAVQAAASLGAVRQELGRLRAGTTEQELRQAQTAVDRAQVGVQLAQEEAQRARMLFAEGVATRAEVDRSEASLAQAEADLASAEARLELLENVPRPEDVRVLEARIREAEAGVALAQERVERRRLEAPFAGTITRRLVDPGEAVSPGMPVLTLVDMDGAEVFFETDENNVARIAQGQRAEVLPLAFPDRPFRAEVFQIGPEVDPQRGVVAVRLRPVEPLAEAFFPEMTVDVNLRLMELEEAMSVPRSAVIEEDEESFVYIVEEQVARRVAVEVLARGEDWIAIEGVSREAWIVVEAGEVREGDRVQRAEITLGELES